jgi:transposase
MKPYSVDLRERIVRSYEQGQGSIDEVATSFSVSTYFVKKMLRQWRKTGSLAPLPHGGGKSPSLTPRQRQLLKRKVRQQSDVTLAELQQLLSEQESVDVHISTISRALSSLGLPRKKSL